MDGDSASPLVAAVDGRTQPGEAERGSGGGWLYPLMTLFLLELLAVLYLLPRDPIIGSRWHALVRAAPLVHRTGSAQGPQPDYRAELKKDPALAAAALPDHEWARIRRVARPAGGGIMLIYMGDHICCMHIDVPAWEGEAARAGMAAVLLSAAAPGDYPRYQEYIRRGLGAASPILNDPSGAIARRLNAFTAPRAYLLARDGRLLWIQRSLGIPYYQPFDEPEFRKAVEEVRR